MADARIVRVPQESRPLRLREGQRIAPWMRDEILDYAGSVMLEENQVQMRLVPPNNPSRIIADGRVAKTLNQNEALVLRNADSRTAAISGFRRRITFVYTDLALLAEAVEHAWAGLLRRTRRRSGFAVNTYYFWCSDPSNRGRSRKYTNLTQVLRWIAASTDIRVNVRILGPTMEYRRGVIYNPRGGRYTSIWQTQNRHAGPDFGQMTSGQIKNFFKQLRRRQAIKAIQKSVVDSTLRKFGGRQVLWIGYRFTRSREPLPIRDNKWRPTRTGNIHIPEIRIGLPIRGLTR